MRIQSSVIGMESARNYTSVKVKYNRYMQNVKDYGRGVGGGSYNLFDNGYTTSDAEKRGEQKPGIMSRESIDDLRDRVESMRNNRIYIRSGPASALDSFRQQTLRYIFSMLFGRDRADRVFGPETTGAQNSGNTATLEFGGVTVKTLSLYAETYEEEYESTSFSSVGTVRTADGREISFNVDVGMSRQFAQTYREELNLIEIQTCDPLVINFNSDTAHLSDQKFYFDIDADGVKDEISMLGSGSGYLALDKNGDGIINDGSELFGPQSGNGFRDLAQYDADGNGWVDENDPIWSKLKIWCKNPDGTDSLYTLAELGVGAICLSNVSTDFALKGEGNQTNGYIRNTGVFLYENGNVGTVQHLDLAQ